MYVFIITGKIKVKNTPSGDQAVSDRCILRDSESCNSLAIALAGSLALRGPTLPCAATYLLCSIKCEIKSYGTDVGTSNDLRY